MFATSDDAPPSALDIRYRLAKTGYSLAELAEQLEVTPSVVSNTISGKITCYAVAKRVAELLKADLSALWPGRYDFKPRARRNAAAGKRPKARVRRAGA